MSKPNNKRFVSDEPSLLSEWNHQRNTSKPNEMLIHSGKKVWWVCSEGHEWEDSINHRSRGRSCPYCSGKRVLDGYNDLATTHPEIIKEWNYEKNGELLPTQISFGSTRRVWWKCLKGHEWQTSPNSRCQNNKILSGCPYCSNKRVFAGYNDLATTNPLIAKEWNYNRNGDLLPSMVTSGSNKKVWWVCTEGHEWQAAISDRRLQGCPYCSRHRAIFGQTDLASTSPKLLNEWDYERNGHLNLKEISISSKKKVWWKCSKGHRWEATINNRQRGDKCPYCSNRKLLVGFNDFKTKCPKLINEWDFEKNHNISPESILVSCDKKVWWKCQLGHSWRANIQYRRVGNGCPICAKRNKTSFPEQIIYYYVHKQYPDAINAYTKLFDEYGTTMELDIFIPSIMTGIEYDGEPWHKSADHHQRELKKYNICKEKGVTLIRIKEDTHYSEHDTCDVLLHISKARSTKSYSSLFHNLSQYISFSQDIDIKRDRLEIQEQYIFSYVANSLTNQFPHIASEWHPTRNGKLKPEMFLSYSQQIVWWLCDKGHEWEARIESRTRSDTGCPICSNKKIVPGINDIATTHPMIASEWNTAKNGKLKPTNVCSGTSKKAWWICEKGHEWEAVIHTRCKGIGCPICANKQVLHGYNDLSHTNPELEKEWNYDKNTNISPDQVTAHSGKKVWWVCSKGHEWQATINHRSNGTGCPICSNRQVLIGFNDFQTVHPELAKEWDYEKNDQLKPTDITSSSRKKVWWHCQYGHEWESYVYNRIHGSGCPICYANRQKSLK